ncbi:ROK family protein OS=Isosphaera pallida (strain ATCC 43644 / DSM 9630 / IS1B) GN=Isop_0741 PE=4 SV=1: ROK [Gemmataceae bacterium]|nr:ROK family protein OS=Isosphaera pallida (strain ATCC 43644 / DSM 9630 / IS1B) GN=Isop_0741 PE=4 SV=1: ROK [Gemmataceae bacterium]VTT99316.1 ROK family protein OS=Isosphaera pallida (strain ATCC 43644 / DSM 9630 / IS1B) GN=Isop_0741 PE=4 SV=1: ROK [Gemmataceae bacterium]
MAGERYFVGLDVGGTTMKCAVVNDHGHPLSAPAVMDTHPERGQDAGLETMCETIRRAVAAANLTLDDVTAIGVATPGLMDIKAGLILDPPNLKPWKNVPVRDHIKGVFKKPTAYQNDANAAAYGEFWVGAAQEAKSMVLFTLGTGVGGGIIINDVIIEGEHSHGGELGHLRIDTPDRGRICGCGARGCLEAYASATNVVRRAREDMAAYRGTTKMRQYYTANDDVFTARVIFDLAMGGDELAIRVVDDTAYYLALGASALISTVDPDMIVFGGGMVGAGERFRSLIDGHVKRLGLTYPTKSVKITFASLGSDAGFIGAAGCARLLVQQAKPA